MLPFRVFQEPKLIIFQVKIIHNILPTQSSLFRTGIKTVIFARYVAPKANHYRTCCLPETIPTRFRTSLHNGGRKHFNKT